MIFARYSIAMIASNRVVLCPKTNIAAAPTPPLYSLWDTHAMPAIFATLVNYVILVFMFATFRLVSHAYLVLWVNFPVLPERMILSRRWRRFTMWRSKFF
jgi:hypothetical protein